MAMDIGRALAAVGVPDAPDTDDDRLDAYIELARLREDLEEDLDQVKRRMAALEPDVLRAFVDRAQQRVTRRGRTAHLRRDIWPHVVSEGISVDPSMPARDREHAAREAGRRRLLERLKGDPTTRHLVHEAYNHQTLRSWMLQDLPRGEDGLPEVPEHLEGALAAEERWSVRVTA